MHGDGPVFELVVEATELRVELRVNDVPVLRLPGGKVSTVFDVNPQVVTGENTLSLIARPPRRGQEWSPHATCSVSLRRRPAVKDERAETLATLVFDGQGANASNGFERSPGYATEIPPSVEPFGVQATQRVLLETPFSPWSWMTAPPMEVTESLRSELFTAYQRVHRMMRARDIAGLAAECAHQAEDWQQAYYLPDHASAVRLLGLPQTFSDPDVEVADFPDTHLEVQLLGHGRLIQLVDANGDAPLLLHVRGVKNMTGRFVAIFCRTAGGLRMAR